MCQCGDFMVELLYAVGRVRRHTTWAISRRRGLHFLKHVEGHAESGGLV